MSYRLAALVVAILGYLCLWLLGLLPSPPFVGPAELADFALTSEFRSLVLNDLRATFATAIACWAGGTLTGIGLGVLVATAGPVGRLPLALVEFLRSIPSIIWVPLAISLFGIGVPSVAGVATLSVFLYVVSEISYSKVIFERRRSHHLARLGVRYLRRVRVAHVYEVLTVATPAARVAITIGLVVVVIGEMLAGASVGLGASLLRYQAGQRFEGMIWVLFLSGVLGLLCSVIGDLLERRLTPWVATK